MIDLATKLGWRHYHTHDSRRSDFGFPDLVLVRRARALFAEIKSDTGKLSPEQKEWLMTLADADAEVYLFRPSEWDDIVQILMSETRPNKYECKVEVL